MYDFQCSYMLYNNIDSISCLSISDVLVTVEEMASREVINYLTVNNMSPSSYLYSFLNLKFLFITLCVSIAKRLQAYMHDHGRSTDLLLHAYLQVRRASLALHELNIVQIIIHSHSKVFTNVQVRINPLALCSNQVSGQQISFPMLRN